VTAKKSLKYWPFLGWFMTLSKTVFIDRANRATARAAFDGAANTMRTERQNVFIFPEGTRSYAEKPELLPFKKGAFHLAIQAQVPIVPVVVANYSNVLNVKRKQFNPGTIDVSGKCMNRRNQRPVQTDSSQCSRPSQQKVSRAQTPMR
jgi:lysophosphatidate acyltransferase